jgi:hypothetical protein
MGEQCLDETLGRAEVFDPTLKVGLVLVHVVLVFVRNTPTRVAPILEPRAPSA